MEHPWCLKMGFPGCAFFVALGPGLRFTVRAGDSARLSRGANIRENSPICEMVGPSMAGTPGMLQECRRHSGASAVSVAMPRPRRRRESPGGA